MKTKTIITFTLLALLTIVFPVSASNMQEDTVKHPITVVFNTDVDFQEYSFIDSNGLETTISIRTINSISGERYIGATNTQISMSYMIWLSNNTITDAYDPYVTSSYWNIFYQNLAVNSTTKATYTVGCSRMGLSTYQHLVATVTGNTITVTLS